jgi:hypothetical protein
MVPIHIWSQNNCQGLNNFDSHFQRFTEGRTRYQNPVLHQSPVRISNEQIVRINYSMLDHRETPNLQILIISNDDFQISSPNWLPGSIQTLFGVAEICPGTVLVCVNLLTDENTEVREKIKRIFAQPSRHFHVDLGQDFGPADLSSHRCISELGARKLKRMLMKVITRMPSGVFLV